jgi:RNA polymerase sigma-70 factor (ECF subfamily)
MAGTAASMTEASDEDRLAEWVRVHGAAVHGFLLATVRSPDLADDLKQEVFCRAWEARERYVEKGKSLAYLLKIADHLVCDRNRRRGLERNINDEQWRENEPLSQLPGPSAAAATSEQTRQLAAAMDRLTPIQQRVLLLRYYGQMSFLEIAETIECPLSTTLSHCHRGLKTLRNQLVE